MKKQNQLKDVKMMVINNVENVSYDQKTNTYVYREGGKVIRMQPHHMIVRTNLAGEGPVVGATWNDDSVRANFRSTLKHPIRKWYAGSFGYKYIDTREITVKRWFNLNMKRRAASDVYQK